MQLLILLEACIAGSLGSGPSVSSGELRLLLFCPVICGLRVEGLAALRGQKTDLTRTEKNNFQTCNLYDVVNLHNFPKSRVLCPT